MTAIRYSPWKLLGLSLITALPAALFMWMLVSPDVFTGFHGRSSFWVHLIADNFWVSGGLFIATGGVTALGLVRAFGDRTALAIGSSGVEVQTLYRQHKLGWAEIVGIGVQDANRGANRQETLVVRIRRDGGEKSLKISTGLLEQSRPEIERILESAGRPATAPGRLHEADAMAAMDYDAAIARHRAGRQGGSMTPPVVRGGFGRKGL